MHKFEITALALRPTGVLKEVFNAVEGLHFNPNMYSLTLRSLEQTIASARVLVSMLTTVLFSHRVEVRLFACSPMNPANLRIKPARSGEVRDILLRTKSFMSTVEPKAMVIGPTQPYEIQRVPGTRKEISIAWWKARRSQFAKDTSSAASILREELNRLLAEAGADADAGTDENDQTKLAVVWGNEFWRFLGPHEAEDTEDGEVDHDDEDEEEGDDDDEDDVHYRRSFTVSPSPSKRQRITRTVERRRPGEYRAGHQYARRSGGGGGGGGRGGGHYYSRG